MEEGKPQERASGDEPHTATLYCALLQLELDLDKFTCIYVLTLGDRLASPPMPVCALAGTVRSLTVYAPALPIFSR